MRETALHQPDSKRSSKLHLVENGNAAAPLDSPQVANWVLLFGALSLAAGHGLFLTFALTQLQRIPSVAELGGVPNALVVGWFVLSIPASILSFLGRRRLMGWPAPRLRRFALLALVLTLAVFVLYVRKMVIV